MATLTSRLIVSLIDEVTAPARGVAAAVRNLEAAQRANTRELDAMRGRMVDAAGAAYAMARAVMSPAKAAIELESAMADIAKVTDFDVPGLKQFELDLRRLASTEIPLAVTELTALAAAAAQSGVAEEDLLGFTRTVAKAAVAWEVTGDAAGESLAKLRSALGMTNEEVGLFADAINHLSDNTASSAPDLVAYARRVAAQGEFYGIAKEQTLAFGAAMIGAGAEAEVAATSFRNMGRALTRGSSATKRQAEAFATLGLDAETVAQRMQEDAVPTIIDVIERLGSLPEHMQASVMSDLFGDEARALAPLLTNVGELERSLGLVAERTEYAGSVTDEFNKRAETTEYTLQRFASQVNEIGIAIGQTLLPALNSVSAALGPMMQAIAGFVAENPQIVQAVIGLAGALVAARVASIAARWAFLFMKGGLIDIALFATRGAAALLALINPINLVKGALMALRLAVIGTGIGAILVGIAMAGIWIYNNWKGLTAFFEGFGAAFMAAVEPIMPVLQPVIDAGAKLLSWIQALTGPVEASEGEWRSWGETLGTIVGGAILTVVEGIQSIGIWIAGATRAIGDFATALGSLTLPEVLNWLWTASASGIRLAIGFATIAVPEVIVWLMGVIGSVATFGIAIDWPEPPGWLTWLMNEGAKLLGMGGDSGTVGGPTPAGTNPDDPGFFLSMPEARAAGGAIVGGTTYLVGEDGPELVTPNRSGWVHTAGETSRMLGGERGVTIQSLTLGGITIAGVQNPSAIVDEVVRQLNDRIGQAFDGIHADIEQRG